MHFSIVKDNRAAILSFENAALLFSCLQFRLAKLGADRRELGGVRSR